MEKADDQQPARTRSSGSSRAWARRFRSGRPEAVREVRRRVQRILAYGGLAIPQQERDDLAQEVMTDLWRAVNRTGFDFSAGFWSFVEVVTSRRSIDWLRARREQAPLPQDLPSPAASPLHQTLTSERSRLATSLLAALDPGCRRLMELRLREGMSYREISAVLGKSEGSLRVKLFRCIRRARDLAAQLPGPSEPGIAEP